MDNNKLYQSKSRCAIELYGAKNAIKRLVKLHLFTYLLEKPTHTALQDQ